MMSSHAIALPIMGQQQIYERSGGGHGFSICLLIHGLNMLLLRVCMTVAGVPRNEVNFRDLI